MAKDTWDGDERRLHHRHPIVFPVEVQVVEPGAPLKRVVGISVRISCSGALLRLDKDVRKGARCRVTFKQSAGRVMPATATGRIRRASAGDLGNRLVVVQFDELLETVKAPGEI